MCYWEHVVEHIDFKIKIKIGHLVPNEKGRYLGIMGHSVIHIN
jgi:hypothetical protein